MSVIEDGNEFVIQTGGVLMWVLKYPLTPKRFDEYLFELDERMTVQSRLWEIPDVEMWEAEGRPSILHQVSDIFGAPPTEVFATLGDEWRPLDLDWVGSTSNPTTFLWTGSSVVALDNANAYLFRRAKHGSNLSWEPDGEAFVEVKWIADIWERGGPSMEWFVPFVLEDDEGIDRGTCPACASGEVTHRLFGMPASPETLPSWVHLQGCIVDGEVRDRRCEPCGHEWDVAT